MKDKSVKAGSVAIGICLLIIAVLLVGIVLMFRKWNIEKILLQSEIVMLENQLKEEKREEQKVEVENNLSNENLEKMAKELLDKYMKLDKYEDYAIGPMANILIDLGFEDEKEFTNWLLDQPFKSLTETIKTNVKYDEFKEALLEYMTDNYFIENFSHYTNMDGYVGVIKGGIGVPLMEVESLKLNRKEENKYTFNVILKDVQLYEHYLNPEEGEKITEEDYLAEHRITFELLNNKLFIDKWE